jgi:hypothetical protein
MALSKTLKDVEIIMHADYTRTSVLSQMGVGAAAPVVPLSFSPVISSIPSTGEQVQKRFESP